MFELLKQIWNYVVYQPQLNLAYFFYQITNDIGITIILIAVIINVPLWYLFGKSYVNTQKMRLLQPELKELQKEYKEKPQEFFAAMKEFNKKHNLSNSSLFQVLILQLFYVSGLLFLVQNIASGHKFNEIYESIFGIRDFTFNNIALGTFNIGSNSSSELKYIWILFLGFFLSWFFGYYTLKLAPHINLMVDKYQSAEEKEKQEAMQKSQEFVAIYMAPFLLIILYWNTSFGLNLYFATLNVLAVIRQFLITNYYKNHIDKLYEEIVNSDNVSRSEITIDELLPSENGPQETALNPKTSKKPSSKKTSKTKTKSKK
jgi:YidC/Oxa1 family membrane protein insertase